jgi:hypothetical protein
VVEFFESLSFKLPPRKGVADFLQEVFLEESFLLSLMVIGKMIFDVILLTWYFHIPGNI